MPIQCVKNRLYNIVDIALHRGTWKIIQRNGDWTLARKVRVRQCDSARLLDARLPIAQRSSPLVLQRDRRPGNDKFNRKLDFRAHPSSTRSAGRGSEQEHQKNAYLRMKRRARIVIAGPASAMRPDSSLAPT